jgi:RNA polymerase sigma-70 factor (ECF subfamily)
VVLWNSDMLNKPDEVRGYLYGIVRHKILDEYRRNAMRLRYANERVNKVEEHYETPDQPLLTKELKKIIDQEIALMPERMREIFQMKKQQKLSIAEIATTLKLSEQTVKNQLYRATNRLKERLLTYDTSMVVIGILLFGLLSYLKD